MNGIASLPQGSNMPQAPQGGPPQAPGQAAPGQMPGMPMPQAQGTPMGVTSLIPPLKQLNVQQLQMELMNPGSQLPKFAVLSALDQKIKEQKAMQAVMGMQAQQQNTQDPGTVAQQVMQAAQQPVMARHGGAMHSYRQGGIVGYQSGGATSYPVKEEWWEKELRRQQEESVDDSPGLLKMLKRAFLYSSDVEKQKEREQQEAREQQEEASAMGVGLPSMTPEAARVDVTQGPLPATSGAPPERLLDTRGIPAPQVKPPAPQAAPPVTPLATPPQAVPQAAAPSDYERRIQELQTTMGAQRNLPPELLESQRGLAALVEQQVQERQKRADEAREEARRALEEARGRQGMSAKDWFALAGGISTEKGQLMGSLGRATAGVLGGKEAEMKEAQKVYNEAQALDRRERDAIGQMRILEGERQLALKQRRYDEANQLEIQIKQLSVEAAKYGAERQDKQRQLAALEMQAEAAKTQAGRESETDRRIRLAKEDPALFSQMYGPKDKDLAFPALKAQADLIAERLKDPLLDANQKAALTAEYNNIMGALSELSGVGGMSRQPLYAVNLKTKERIVSTDGGATWNPAK